MESGKSTGELFDLGARHVSFSPDGLLLATCGFLKGISLWDLSLTPETRTLTLSKKEKPVAIDPKVTMLAIAGKNKVTLRDLETKRQVALFDKQDNSLCVFSPDGDRFAICQDKGKVEIWSVHHRNKLDVVQTDGYLTRCCFSPDGNQLALGINKNIEIWNLKQKERMVLKGHTRFISCLKFSSDGTSLVSGSNDATIRIWDLKNPGRSISILAHEGSVSSVAFSPDGKLIASCGSPLDNLNDQDRTIVLWEAATGKEHLSLGSGSRIVHHLQFSSDGKTLFSWGIDQRVKPWRANHGTVKAWSVTEG